MDRRMFNGEEVQEKDFGRYEFDYMAENCDIILKLKTPETKIKELKAQLQSTDYKAIKYAEGLITEEEYAEIKTQRQAWRDEINELEGQLK